MSATKSDTLHMRVATELKVRLREEARRRHIDVSALVSIVMTQWLASHGGRPLDASGDLTALDVSPQADNTGGKKND